MHIDFISSFMIFSSTEIFENGSSATAINLYYYFSSKLCGLMCLFMILFTSLLVHGNNGSERSEHTHLDYCEWNFIQESLFGAVNFDFSVLSGIHDTWNLGLNSKPGLES